VNDIRNLSTDDLNAVTGGCRTVDPRGYIDSIVAHSGGAFAGNPTANPGPQVTIRLTIYAPPV
jgi:hypothetical protein